MQKEKHIGITVKKSKDFSEWFTQICGEQGAKLADVRYGVQGFVVHRPWAFKILRKVYELLEKEVEEDGHEPFLFPTVIPEENLLKEKEHAGFTPEVFWVTEAGSQKLERRLALRPTGETALYPMYSLWIRSYNDLPFKRYQSRITVFRNEMTTRPFLRGREFMFFETHDVFAKHEHALNQIKKDMEIMKKVIYKKIKIPFIFFKRPQWDKFLGAEDTFVSDTLMPDGKRNQLSSTHDLGHRFAKAFDVKFTDKDGKEKYGYQTCFGPGIWRIMAALIGVHGDDTGLILPSCVAPIQIVIIPIPYAGKSKSNEEINKRCKLIERELKKSGYGVKIDDSEETPGYKYNEWEMLGVPLRIEIGKKELEKEITIVKRIDRKKIKIRIKNLKKEIKKHLQLNDEKIKERADEYFKGNTKEANTLAEVKSIIEKHRGFVKAPFCSIDSDGEKCADILKEKTNGGKVSGVKFINPEKPEGKCIICSKKAKHVVYIAKSY